MGQKGTEGSTKLATHPSPSKPNAKTPPGHRNPSTKG